MRRKVRASLAAAAAVGAIVGVVGLAGPANAGVTEVQADFGQDLVHRGDTVKLQVDTFQHGNLIADATTLIRFPAGALVFVGNGDKSATCTHKTSRIECSYTDFAHTTKSDSFTFTVADDADLGDLIARVTVTTKDGNSDTNKACLEVKKSPSSSPTPSHTPTATPTASETPTATPSETPSETPTATPSETPTETPTPSESPTNGGAAPVPTPVHTHAPVTG